MQRIQHATSRRAFSAELCPVLSLDPAISINDHIFTDVTTTRAEQIARRAIRGEDVHEPHPEQARIACKADPYDGGEKYGVVPKLIQSRAWDDVLSQLRAAELKGMGGAGFPTSMKWDLVRKQHDPIRYVVCNADESEPGTIKDRFIMTNLPHLLIEGMVIAGLVTGAKRGILYIRHEYHLQEEILGEEIRRCYRSGLLGKKIFGSELDFGWLLLHIPLSLALILLGAIHAVMALRY